MTVTVDGYCSHRRKPSWDGGRLVLLLLLFQLAFDLCSTMFARRTSNCTSAKGCRTKQGVVKT